MKQIFDSKFGRNETSLSKGEVLFHQGDFVKRFFFLSKGRVKLTRNGVDGEPIVLHVAVAGETIAEASLFADKYHCTAISSENSLLYSVSKELLVKDLSSLPDEVSRLMSVFAKQIHQLRSLLEIRSIRSASERIYQYLLLLSNPEGEVILTQSLKDTAYKIGLAHETFYREMRLLEESGRITRDGEQIKIK